MIKSLFKSFRNKKGDQTRVLTSPDQLNVDDIITFKYRTELPESLREQSLSVVSIAGYEYASGINKEISLKDSQGNTIFMSFETDDGDDSICLSIKIPREAVLTLFDEDVFAGLFDDAGVDELRLKNDVPEYVGWYTKKYTQTIKNATAYFYPRDPGKEDLTQADDGKELLYHECESADGSFGVNVEVWQDGETDIFLQVYIDSGAIAQMYPHG